MSSLKIEPKAITLEKKRESILTIKLFVDLWALLQRRSFVVGNRLKGGGNVPPSSK